MAIIKITIIHSCGHTEDYNVNDDDIDLMESEARALAECMCSECSSRDWASKYN